MITFSQSAKLYQERRSPADQNTRRLPGMRFSPDEGLVHTLPLKSPFPSVEMILLGRDQPPDAGRTDAWPRGEEEIA